MENRKPKIFISIMIILLCLSVSIGFTYAYFVDSAKSSGNKIQSGSLKLDLQLYDKVDGWQSIKNSEAPIFNYDKWEPGYVDAKLLKIENLGALAMQWEAKLVSANAVSEFADSIEIYTKTSNTEMAYPASRAEALTWNKLGTLDQFINTAEKLASGTFMTKGEAFYIGIVLYMPVEITNNDLQGQLLGAFDIQINATQLAYESDVFDEKYDEDAKLPCGHYETEVIKGYDATCTEEGLSDGKKCAECGTIVVPQQALPILDHTESDWIIDVPAGEGTEGSRHTECTVCGEPMQQETIPALPTSIFTWRLNDDGKSYTVTGLKESETVTDLVIPSTYNGLPVTAIGNTAFWGGADALDPIFSVTIPNSVTTIGNYAFYNSMISEITIPASVTTIGYNPFVNCTDLSNIIVDENNTAFQSIGGSLYSKDGTVLLAYAPCGSLTPSESLANVSIIGHSAFENCQNVYDVTIPSNVTTIGEKAFLGCYFLMELVIENGVTTIGDFAFSWCHNLMGCDIPSSVTTIGKGAFEYCPGSFINVDANNAAYKSINGSLYSKDGTVLVAYTYEAYNEDFTIPNNVTTIEDYAFCSYNHLEKIIIPDSVTTIGEQTFYYCSNLTEIIFNGTTAQWNAISFGFAWKVGVPATEVVCSDGNVAIN